jgi:hypothetical protein
MLRRNCLDKNNRFVSFIFSGKPRLRTHIAIGKKVHRLANKNMSSIIDRIKNLFSSKDTSLSYGQAKKLASDQNSDVRRELAERQDAKPEILYF